MNSATESALAVAMVASMLAGAGFLAMTYRAGRVMRQSGGPGIVAFELAESPQEADRHLRAWGAAGRRAARRSIMWDFALVAAYVVLLAAAALHLAVRANDTGYGALAGVAWGAVAAVGLAGLLDWVEHVVLLGELSAHDARVAQDPMAFTPRPGRVRAARVCAQVKFLLLQAVVVTILVGFGVLELSGRPSSPRTALTVLLAVPVAAAVFLAAIRLRPPAPARGVETLGLAPPAARPAAPPSLARK